MVDVAVYLDEHLVCLNVPAKIDVRVILPVFAVCF
jgi:hypothetical protein